MTARPGSPAAATPEAEPGPIIAPPLYGRWHAAQTVVPEDTPRWFRELNLDPRHRVAAAANLGGLVLGEGALGLLMAVLRHQLDRAELIIDAQKKLCVALGLPSADPPSEDE